MLIFLRIKNANIFMDGPKGKKFLPTYKAITPTWLCGT